jgi:acyl-CoA reductase-like NAD-dependent aldehyde dehydrogenase
MATKAHVATQRLVQQIEDELPDPDVERLVAAAVAAQKEFESWPEDKVDALLADIVETITGHAEELATATVAETHIGNVPDKVMKIGFASRNVFEYLAGKPGSGVIREDPERKLVEIASPVGVIVGLVPVTNPVPTFVNKTLISLKARNAIIFSTHRMAQGVGTRAGELIREALIRNGAPAELVQWFANRTSRKQTAKLMSHENVAMILATGGPGMVKAAYSSGKPSSRLPARSCSARASTTA